VSGGGRSDDATVSVRRRDTLSEFSTDWSLATAGLLSDAVPWRTFRWHRGQKHYSGTYWSSTEAAHVIYESRLELARLLYADFDVAVGRIFAQPFLLKATVDRRVRKHVPDFLLMTEQGPVVVDVKPLARLANPRIRFTLDWTRKLVEGRGWRYEFWSEPPATHAGYDWHMRAATWATNRDIAAARLSWEHGEKIADALPAEDPHRAAMRITPHTMLCGIAFRVQMNVAGALLGLIESVKFERAPSVRRAAIGTASESARCWFCCSPRRHRSSVPCLPAGG
jgi:hypothetical protein